MDEMVFLNGRVLPANEAKVSVFDAGLAHGVGLFETLRAFKGRLFRLREHLARMEASATALHIAVKVDAGVIERGALDVLEANGLDDARVRITGTPGAVPRPNEEAVVPVMPTLLITAGKPQTHPAELYQHGMRVCICPYKQNRHDPLAGHKTLGYLPRLLAMKGAAERRCHESLWFNTDNQLAEGSICNVFVVRQGRIVTPPLDTPVLPGIVRGAVLELAQAAGLEAEETPIDIDALLASEEVFLTGSVMGIMPVTSIERHTVGDGLPGGATRRMTELYQQLVAKECGLDA